MEEPKGERKLSYAVPRRNGSKSALNLFLDARTGIYVWRRTDETTGRRVKRSTGTANLSIARSAVV